MSPGDWLIATQEVNLRPPLRLVVQSIADFCQRHDTDSFYVRVVKDEAHPSIHAGDRTWDTWWREIRDAGLCKRVRSGVYTLSLPWHMTGARRRVTKAEIERMLNNG